MYHAQFPDRRMLNHRIFQWLHRQVLETDLFHVSRRRAVQSPSLEESILNAVADRPKSSTRAMSHHLSGSNRTVCIVFNENR
ncbi:hypothetical protein TNCV_4499981 [Trichonephila clavipes]|nr:hypothetical protein TNCV_4499981 [Trichonephila clavipes]